MPDIIGGEAVIPFTIGTEPPPVITSQTVDVSIRCEVLNGVWETFGVDRDIEVDPETLETEWDEWGCLKASFVLKRNPWAAWPDLSPFTPVEVEVGGVLVWEGRLGGTPLKAGAEAQISVQCEGWPVHLDDDLLKRVYVHSTLTDWKDLRTSLEAQLGTYTAAPQVQAETGVITLTQPEGTFVKPGQAFGVFLDLGEAAARKMVIQIGETNVVGGTDHKFYCRGAATMGAISSGPYEEGLTPFQIEGTSNTTHVATFATPHRYVGIFSYQAAGEGAIAADEYLKITAISVFSEEAYESGDAYQTRTLGEVKSGGATIVVESVDGFMASGSATIGGEAFSYTGLEEGIPAFTGVTGIAASHAAFSVVQQAGSILRASTVIESVLPYAPLLSTDISQVNPYAGSGEPELEDDFDIPSLVVSASKTPRQIAESVNAFHNWITQIDLQRRMVFKPPSTEPLLEYGAWSGEAIEDQEAGNANDIYDSVTVEGVAANGEALSVTVTAADLNASTVVDERGFTRAKAISLSNATDETVMTKIGEVWLADQLVVPFAGALTVPVGGLRTVLGGQPVHPSLIGYHINEMLRAGHAIDPSSGGVGRDGRLVSAVYTHAEQAAQVTLGARTSSVEALLARLAVVQEASS